MSILFILSKKLNYYVNGRLILMDEIEVIIKEDMVLFEWNDETIQEMAEELGEPEFPEPRPCG